MTTIDARGTSYPGTDTSEPAPSGAGYTGGVEMVIEEMIERDEDAASAARSARTAARDARTTAKLDAVSRMREAADWEFAAGIARGSAKACSAVASAGGALSGSGSSGTGEPGAGSATATTPAADAPATAAPAAAAPAAPTDAGTAAASSPGTAGESPSPKTPSGGRGNLWGAAGSFSEAGGDLLGAGFDKLSAGANAGAETDRTHAETLGDIADDQTETLSAMERARDKALEAFSRFVEEKRRAEDAATRA